MEFFLVTFTISGLPLAKVAVHGFMDTALLEAWYSIQENLLDDDAKTDLYDLLTVASESDDPLIAFKNIQLQPCANVDEIIELSDYAAIGQEEFEQYALELEQGYASRSDASLYMAAALVSGDLVLVTTAKC